VNLPPEGITREIVNSRIGAEIRRLRMARGITLRQLAKTIGISHPYLSDVEKGRRAIRKRLPAIAEALGVGVHHFVDACGVCPTCHGTGVIE